MATKDDKTKRGKPVALEGALALEELGKLESLGANAACVYVDFAGNAALRLAIHTRFVALRSGVRPLV